MTDAGCPIGVCFFFIGNTRCAPEETGEAAKQNRPGTMKYRNFETLRKNQDFQKVYREHNSFSNRMLVLYTAENHADTIRLGVSVSKKVGNSIVRHRLARLIREAFRLNADNVQKNCDYIFIARTGLINKGYKETENAMLKLLGEAGRLQNDEKNSNQADSVLPDGDITV